MNKFLVILFTILSTLFISGNALAAIVPGVGAPGTPGCDSFGTCTDIPNEAGNVGGFSDTGFVTDLVTKFLPAVTGIGAFLSVIMIIISGIQFITSSGNPEAAAAARGRLTFAIVGFVLLVLAFAITVVVETVFLKTTVFQ